VYKASSSITPFIDGLKASSAMAVCFVSAMVFSYFSSWTFSLMQVNPKNWAIPLSHQMFTWISLASALSGSACLATAVYRFLTRS
jgi:hypothetical protein